MTFVPFSMLSQRLIAEISMDSDKVDKDLFKKPILTEPVLATRVLGKFADYPVKSLSELFEDPNIKETTFRARFYIIKITPDNVEKFVEMHTPKESKE